MLILFLAKNIVENYRHGVIARPGMTFDELWGAKYLYDSAFHPDTKEKMFILGRMSAQGFQRRRFSLTIVVFFFFFSFLVPCNMLITGFMLTVDIRWARLHPHTASPLFCLVLQDGTSDRLLAVRQSIVQQHCQLHQSKR